MLKHENEIKDIKTGKLDTLVKCPFCGGVASCAIGGLDDYGYCAVTIGCCDCDVEMYRAPNFLQVDDVLKEMIKVWNKRVR